MHEQGVNAILADEMVSSESYYDGFLIKDQEYKQTKIAWEKNQHFATPSLVSPPNFCDVWGATAERRVWLQTLVAWLCHTALTQLTYSPLFFKYKTLGISVTDKVNLPPFNFLYIFQKWWQKSEYNAINSF